MDEVGAEQAPLETAPLLGPEPDNDQPTAEPTAASNTKSLKVVTLVFMIILICDFAGILSYAPQLQLFEEIICARHYASSGGLGEDGVLDPARCKSEPVQAELALVNGWKDAFETIPGILLALPYGALADRIGYKPVLLLGIFGCFLGDLWVRLVCWLAPLVPLRAVWFSAIFQLIGGGPQTTTSMMFVMVAHSCSPEQRAFAFSQLYAGLLVAEILASPLSAALMPISPWLPYAIGFGLSILGNLLGLLVPSTKHNKQTERRPVSEATNDESQTDTRDLSKSLKHRFSDAASETRRLVTLLWQNSNVLLVLMAFIVANLSRSAIGLTLQYVSKRYGWTIAKATYLISLRAVINLLVLMVLIPGISAFLTSRIGMSVRRRDKLLTQVSFALKFLGFVVIFLAFRPALIVIGMVVFALGSGFAIPARSLATELADENSLGLVYTAIAVAQSVGVMVAGPLLAYFFRIGMRLGESWMGLPFLVASGLYVMAFVSVSLTRLQIHD